MTILGLETSTAVCSVGLFRENRSAIELSLRESHIHSEKLLTLVRDVLSNGETTLEQLDAIAISIGPGSFTGLRIGLSTAKGLSFALDKPVVSMPTFEGIAVAGRQKYPEVSTIYVVMDAKRDEWYVGGYHFESGTATQVVSVGVKSLKDSLAGAVSGSLVLTDKVDEVKQALNSAAIVDDALQYCRGDVVAFLGYRKALSREYADVAALEPTYLKDFVVRTAVSVS